ncbi:MAG TPA: Na+/glucose cotransporter [Phycisphaerales bacterium]|nr:Na+/glucose cotransporter [Phycisphaerales bacterium]
MNNFQLHFLDYLAFGTYLLIVCGIGFWAGRKTKSDSEDYFLAGRSLPWYVIGASYIAANISTEHFIGMIGATYIFGISVAMYEWGNINSFSVLIWLFIPFLLATRVFTIPEFLEKRFNIILRQFFACLSVVSNVFAFLAAVLYGGGVALQTLFGWRIEIAIIALGAVTGTWAIYGGLKSVAWMDLFTLIIMIFGGIMVAILGLYMLSGDEHSLVKGWQTMIEANKANSGVWAQAVSQNARNMAASDTYNRLSVIQPATHIVVPWPSLIYGFLAIGIWYTVLNQFMIQRVFGAKNMYHARMGIVFAGYMKILMPVIVVVPGLILFAVSPEIMLKPWEEIRPAADQSYVRMLQMVVPIGLRGLFLAALFGAIQSTVNAVLNSTATIVTLDIYKRMINKKASEKKLVTIGIISSISIIIISILMAGIISKMQLGLFMYIQILYAFFAPPFAAIFLLGILYNRINSKGATAAVFSGFAFGILLKVYLALCPNLLGAAIYDLVVPFGNQALLSWLFSVIVCLTVSLVTAPPKPEQVSDNLTLNWKKMNIFGELGDKWYKSVILWWSLFAACIAALILTFSQIVFGK